MSDNIRLDYASFESTLFSYCQDLSGISKYVTKKVGANYLSELSRDFFDQYILLAAGLTDENVATMIEGGRRKNGGLTASQLSRYRSGKDRNKGIEKAYLQKGSIERTREHFKKYLLPMIIRDGEKAILYDIWQLIRHDDTIPQVYREDFEYFYGIESLAAFLANVFVFAITRPVSVNIQALEEMEKKKPKLHPDTAKIIRDVQLRGETEVLVVEFERMCRLLDDETLDTDIRTATKYDAAILWRETNGYIRPDNLDEASRRRFERLKDISYSFEYYDAIEKGRQTMFDEIYKLDDKYD